METSIQFILGIFFLIMGTSYMVATNNWVMWLEYIERQGVRGSLNLGMINLLFGAFILSGYWVWQGPAMTISLIAVLMILKGSVYLLYPGWLPAKLSMLHSALPNYIKISGFIVAFLGVALLCNWVNEMGYWKNFQFIGVAEGVAHVN